MSINQLVKENTSENEVDKIVIVGNGFDISMGIKSSYQNFIDYIKDKYHFSKDLELYEYNRLFLRKYEDFQLNWSDFESLYEESVKKVNNRTKHEDLQDSFEITGINDAIKKLELDFYEYISDEYQKWLQQNIAPNYGSSFKRFSKKINPTIKALLSDEKAYFINFNYTDTLEDLSEDILYEKILGDESIPENEKISTATRKIKKSKERIAHIHGSIEDDNILFGGGFADKKDTIDIHYSKSLLNDKLFRIKENDKLNTTRKNIMDELKKTEKIDKIEKSFDLYIVGHSLQGSDFQFLTKILEDAERVFIFYYESDYAPKMEELIRRLGSEIIEKIILVPFVEILFEDQLIISNYKKYEAIEPFLTNKFPNEKILENLSLTARHFIFKNITEMAINSENIKIILELIEKLKENNVTSPIKKISFTDSFEDKDVMQLKNSKAFVELLKTVEKISFENTGIDIGFLRTIFEKGKKLSYLSMSYCTLLNNKDLNVDISICESLVRLEIKDCTFNPEGNDNRFVFTSEKLDNNIEKLVIVKNTDIVIDNTVLNKAKNMLELSIVLSDTDEPPIEGHLKNIEALYVDCSAAEFPPITVGNRIKELTITGYAADKFIFSSLLKSDDSYLGFPQFRLLQLNSPDSIRSFKDIEIDVLLDVFSKKIKLIMDEEIISIDEYYRVYKPVQLDPFLSSTKKIIEKTFTNILDPEENISEEIVLEFEEWYSELNESIGIIEQENDFLSLIKNQLIVSKEPKEKDEEDLEEKNNFELKDDISKNVSYPEIDQLLFNYAKDEIRNEEIILYLAEKKKHETVVNIYKDIMNHLSHKKEISQSEVAEIRKKQFISARLDIVDKFSKKWFVSSEKLELSAIQYVKEMDAIPAIADIIDSKDYESYKTLHPAVKPFQYPQAMKRAWGELLDDTILLLNAELL